MGLKGIKPENVEDVERLVTKTLDEVVAEGFSDEDIASSMNTIEFQVGYSTPRVMVAPFRYPHNVCNMRGP